MSSVKIDFRELRNVVKTTVQASKAQSRALASAGNILRRHIKEGMKAGHPGGEVWPKAHPWTRLGSLKNRYVKRTRTWGRTKMSWTELRGAKRSSKWSADGGKKPLARLAQAVRYRKYTNSGADGSISDTKVKIGFLTARAGKLAEYHATGGQMPVTNKMRRLIYAAGLIIRRSSIKVPKRRHVEPVYERYQSRIGDFVARKVAAAVKGNSGGGNADLS